jgi:hypothetical protein
MGTGLKDFAAKGGTVTGRKKIRGREHVLESISQKNAGVSIHFL